MAGEHTPAVVMGMIQVGFAGLNILSKLAMDSGMNPFVLVAYRQIFAAAFLSPFAYFWERKTRPKITGNILLQIFFSSLSGATMNQCLYFLGLKYTDPTIGCALANLLPAITFLMAVPFRMETIRIKTMVGQAKFWGTAFCVGGAMLMTFYKGKLVHTWASPVHWTYAENLTSQVSGKEEQIVLGSMLIIASCFTWAVWFIIEAKMGKNFSSPYSSSAIMMSMASVECTIIGVIAERNVSGWVLGWNVRLVAAAYSGIVVSGISFALMTWCIERRGPLFVSMFSPLLLIIVAVLGWAILDEKLHAGSVAGSALIVGGLYAVLWGKGKEMKELTKEGKSLNEKQAGGETGLPITSKMIETEGEKSEENGKIESLHSHSIDCARLRREH